MANTGNNALLGEAGIGSTLLGGITSAVSGFVQGEDQQQMYNYQAGVARLNSQISQQNATYATQVGDIQAEQAGLQGAQRMGKIKSAQGASGLDVNSGSNKQVQTSQAQITSTDQTAIRSNAARTAYNYENMAVGFGAQANADTIAGQNARSAGLLNAGSSLLSSASSVSSQWLRGQSLGMWGSPS
jgi:hypothetical protein